MTHSFRNQRTFPVQLYWLDQEGRAVPYGVVQPDMSLFQETYAGHAWRMVDERSGVALAEYVGPSATLTLQADGSLRVEAAAEPAAPEAPQAPAPEKAAVAGAEAATDGESQ